MEQVLHSDLAGEVGKHHDTVVRTLIGRSITQRRHAVGEVEQFVHTLHTGTGSGHRGRLGNGVDTYMVFTSVDVTEAAGNGFQQCLGICHIVVTVERTLRSHITQSQN